MSWTAPKTFTANSILTFSELNTYLRDNLNESFAAKATGSHRYAVVSSANLLVQREAVTARIDTGETTTSTAYVNLATPGPAVTVTTGTQALVFVTCAARASVAGEEARMSFEVSGSVGPIVATDNYCVLSCDAVGGNYVQCAATVVPSLTAQSNTFTAKYRSSSVGSTANFIYRNIIVLPL